MLLIKTDRWIEWDWMGWDGTERDRMGWDRTRFEIGLGFALGSGWGSKSGGGIER